MVLPVPGGPHRITDAGRRSPVDQPAQRRARRRAGAPGRRPRRACAAASARRAGRVAAAACSAAASNSVTRPTRRRARRSRPAASARPRRVRGRAGRARSGMLGACSRRSGGSAPAGGGRCCGLDRAGRRRARGQRAGVRRAARPAGPATGSSRSRRSTSSATTRRTGPGCSAWSTTSDRRPGGPGRIRRPRRDVARVPHVGPRGRPVRGGAAPGLVATDGRGGVVVVDLDRGISGPSGTTRSTPPRPGCARWSRELPGASVKIGGDPLLTGRSTQQVGADTGRPSWSRCRSR